MLRVIFEWFARLVARKPAPAPSPLSLREVALHQVAEREEYILLALRSERANTDKLLAEGDRRMARRSLARVKTLEERAARFSAAHTNMMRQHAAEEDQAFFEGILVAMKRATGDMKDRKKNPIIRDAANIIDDAADAIDDSEDLASLLSAPMGTTPTAQLDDDDLDRELDAIDAQRAARPVPNPPATSALAAAMMPEVPSAPLPEVAPSKFGLPPPNLVDAVAPQSSAVRAAQPAVHFQ
jgi:hypothetical protein